MGESMYKNLGLTCFCINVTVKLGHGNQHTVSLSFLVLKFERSQSRTSCYREDVYDVYYESVCTNLRLLSHLIHTQCT